MKFWVYIWFNEEAYVTTEVRGTQTAYEFYRKAVELTALVDGAVYLIDLQTGEVIESTNHRLAEE